MMDAAAASRHELVAMFLDFAFALVLAAVAYLSGFIHGERRERRKHFGDVPMIKNDNQKDPERKL